MNMYAYVGGDPVNSRDPSGLTEDDEVITTASQHRSVGIRPFGGFNGSNGSADYDPRSEYGHGDEIVTVRSRIKKLLSGIRAFPNSVGCGILKLNGSNAGIEKVGREFVEGRKNIPGLENANTTYLFLNELVVVSLAVCLYHAMVFGELFQVFRVDMGEM